MAAASAAQYRTHKDPYRVVALDLEQLERRLTRWLRDQADLEDVSLIDFMVPEHGGMSHETILCRGAWTQAAGRREEDLVIRVEPSGPLIFPRYDLAFQCDVMRALAQHSSIAVPEVLWFEADSKHLGRPFYIMRRVVGDVPSDNPPFLLGGPLFDATPALQAKAQRNIVETLASLHDLDWRQVGLSVAERPEFGSSGLDQEFGYWRRYLDWASKENALPVLEAAYAWCLEHRPENPSPDVFNWGDARYGNVIYGADFDCNAVLDWEMAVIGPCELDLGWFLFIHETVLMWLEDLPGFANREGVVALYREARGVTPHDLHFYEAWAGFKTAAIRARMIQRDFEAGLCEDLSAQQRNPILKSLRRLIELPRP